MRAVKSKDTGAEIIVRRILHGAGYRYRLHRKDLPGKPDLVFPGRRKVVFIHGCFWHQHPGCSRADKPSSNTEYWTKKLNANTERDARNVSSIIDKGWQVMVVWECCTKNKQELLRQLTDFLDGGTSV